MMPLLKTMKGAYEASNEWQAEAEALRLICLKSGVSPAMKAAEARGVSQRVVSVLKAAAPAVTVASGDGVSGSPTSAWSGFEGALRTSSVFDAVAAESLQSQFHVRIGMLASQLGGAKVAEGAAKLGQTLLFAQNTLVPVKLASLLAVTQEFLDAAPGAAESLMRALRIACSSAADLEFLTEIALTNSDTPNPPGTGTLADILADVQQLLGMIDYSQNFRLWLVLDPSAARAMAAACVAAGISTMGILGGSFMGVRTMVSDSLPAGNASLIDASGIVTASTPITIKASDQTTVELATTSAQTSATPTPASMTSMFQTNSTALLAERSIAFASLRPNTYATLTSISWSTGVDSPLP